MGGSTQQVQNQNSNQRINQSTQSSPWDPAQPYLQQILGQAGGQIGNTGLTGTETNALAGLQSNAAAGNPYAKPIGQLATDLLGGGQDRSGYATQAYDEARAGLLPYTTMSTDPYNNSAFTKAAGYMSGDIINQLNSAYAGAGVSPTGVGSYARDVGEGVSKGIAPTWLQASNDLENRKLGAINTMYGAGNTTAGVLSGLDQTALGNRQAGVGVAGQALSAADQPYMQQLAIEAQRRGIPLSSLAGISSLIVPMAQLGGTSNTSGTQTGTQTTTGQTQVPWQQQLAGGLLGGAGLLGQTGAFGGSGWLTNLFK